MYRACKLCGECMIFSNPEVHPRNTEFPRGAEIYKCPVCKEYSLVSNGDTSHIINEKIMIGNYSCTFYPQAKEMQICVQKSGWWSPIKRLRLNELTHEAAAQWVNKLKTYVLFQ